MRSLPNVPLHIWGTCGVGKSQIVAQVASDLGWQFLDMRAVQLDPVDLRGLPRISADQAEWVPQKFLPTSGKGLFLDELTARRWWSSQRGTRRPSVVCTFPCPGRCAIASST